MSVQVIQDGNKWILEKGSARIEYKDDGDGLFNAQKDTVVAQSGDVASIFTKEDLLYVQKSSVFNTNAEISGSTLFNALPTQSQQVQTQQTTEPQKRTFWQKLGNGLTGAMGIFSGILGAFLGFGVGSWAYDSGSFNDWRVRGFSGLSTGLLAGSSALSGLSNPYSAGINGMNMNNQMAAIFEAYNNDMIQRQEAIDNALKAQQEAAIKQQGVATVKGVFDAANKDGATINDSNKEYINSIYEVDKKEYTKEEAENAQLIAQYPTIPYEAISKDGEEGKLSVELAEKIDKMLREYETTDDPDTEISKSVYTRVQSFLQEAKEGKLTDEHLESLRSILKDYEIMKASQKEDNDDGEE